LGKIGVDALASKKDEEATLEYPEGQRLELSAVKNGLDRIKDMIAGK